MTITSVITNVVPSTTMTIPSAINKGNTTVAITSPITTTVVIIVVITSDTTSKIGNTICHYSKMLAIMAKIYANNNKYNIL